MYQAVYIIFGILSLISIMLTSLISYKAYKSKGRGKRIFTSLHLLTIGVFIATVLVFLPVYYTGYDFEDSYAFIRPFLIAIHHALRVFILDGEFDTIRDAVSGIATVPHVLFSAYAALLYVIAPVLTFSNVLSLFKNIKGEIRFYWYKGRPFYIFSELNERSVAMADSILKKTSNKPPVIVFTDVFEQDEEKDYELLLKAHDMNAICLKKDITRLNVKKKKEQVEFFLMGDDETENIAQALKLTEENREYDQRSIYLFSDRASAGYILDSVDQGGKTVSESLIQIVEENPVAVIDSFDKLNYQIDGGFYLRRINSVELLVQQILQENDLLETLFERAKGENLISILIVGLGKYGKQFLKSVLWLFQIYGLKLEINVIDSKKEDNLKKSLEQEWPEIISKNPMSEPGDANYTINFIGGIDCFTSEFDKLFENQTSSTNLSKTQLAIVALGDDEKNIEVAVTLRRLFEFMATINNSDHAESPLVYSVVYDAKKAESLSISDSYKSTKGLVNHKDTPYDIHFIGSLKSQFSYSIIEKQKQIEARALKQHLDWVTKTRQLREYYCKDGFNELKVDVVAHFAKKKKAYFEKNHTYEGWIEEWNDDSLYALKDGRPDYSKPNPDKIKEEIEKYFKFEYYRQSSIAKAIYNELVNNHLKDYFNEFDVNNEHQEDKNQNGLPICLCQRCVKRRISEHMRWNVYMRVNGYKRAIGERHDLARLHNDLIPWDELDELEKYKD